MMTAPFSAALVGRGRWGLPGPHQAAPTAFFFASTSLSLPHHSRACARRACSRRTLSRAICMFCAMVRPSSFSEQGAQDHARTGVRPSRTRCRRRLRMRRGISSHRVHSVAGLVVGSLERTRLERPSSDQCSRSVAGGGPPVLRRGRWSVPCLSSRGLPGPPPRSTRSPGPASDSGASGAYWSSLTSLRAAARAAAGLRYPPVLFRRDTARRPVLRRVQLRGALPSRLPHLGEQHLPGRVSRRLRDADVCGAVLA